MHHILGTTIMVFAMFGSSLCLAQSTVPDLYRQSYTLETRGDIAGALKAMEDLAVKGVSDYTFTLRKAWLLYSNGRHTEAVVGYTRACEQEPKAVEPKLGLMLPLMALRRWKEAEKAGNDVLALAPGDFTATSRLAYIFFLQGQYEKAESWYRKTLAAYPSNVEMRAGLAWSLLKQNRFKEARKEFDSVLTVAPDNTAARDGLSQIP
jgi:Flp pilus assembly protein TadD